MAPSPRLYDLVIALSVTADEARRAKILSDVEAQVAAAGGQMERGDDWGSRPLAYEIAHQGEGEYHLLQFTAPTELIEPLSYNLRIDDAVLRFRIIRNVPGTPPPPESVPPIVVGAGAVSDRPDRSERSDRSERD